MLDLLEAGIPANTRKAYANDRREWQAFTRFRGVAPLPIDALDLAEFVTHSLTVGSLLVGNPKPLSPATVERRLAAISALSVEGGHGRPDTRAASLVLRGHRRSGPVPQRRAAPLSVNGLTALIAHITGGELHPAGLRPNRDRAIVLLGFALGARRSELVRIRIEDITVVSEGLLVSVLRLKTSDMHSVVAVPWASSTSICAARAVIGLRTVLAARGVAAGPLFTRVSRSDALLHSGLSAESISDILAKHARAIALPVPDGFGQWSGHSLRRGFATAARQAGADALTIARHGGWCDGSAALAGYLADVDRWQGHALTGVL